MKNNYDLKSITLTTLNKSEVTPYRWNRIPTFDNLNLMRYELTFDGYMIGFEKDDSSYETLDTGFSIPLSEIHNPIKYLIFLLKTVKEIHFSKYDKNDIIINRDVIALAPELKNIDTKEVILFIKKVNPNRTEFKIDELEMVEQYKYAFYSTLKLLSELMVDNLSNFYIHENFEELIYNLENQDIIFKS